jgi:hypothetical protein
MVHTHQVARATETNLRGLRAVTNQGVNELSFRPELDPLARLSAYTPGRSIANIHASALRCGNGSGPMRAGRSLLQFQRQYGNRYVQRVLVLAGQREEVADVSAKVEDSIERLQCGPKRQPSSQPAAALQRQDDGDTSGTPMGGQNPYCFLTRIDTCLTLSGTSSDDAAKRVPLLLRPVECCHDGACSAEGPSCSESTSFACTDCH